MQKFGIVTILICSKAAVVFAQSESFASSFSEQEPKALIASMHACVSTILDGSNDNPPFRALITKETDSPTKYVQFFASSDPAVSDTATHRYVLSVDRVFSRYSLISPIKSNGLSLDDFNKNQIQAASVDVAADHLKDREFRACWIDGTMKNGNFGAGLSNFTTPNPHEFAEAELRHLDYYFVHAINNFKDGIKKKEFAKKCGAFEKNLIRIGEAHAEATRSPPLPAFFAKMISDFDKFTRDNDLSTEAPEPASARKVSPPTSTTDR